MTALNALSSTVTSFTGHQHRVCHVSVFSDSKRLLSADVQGSHRVWQADTGAQLVLVHREAGLSQTQLFGNTVFQLSGKNNNMYVLFSFQINYEN